MKQLTQKRIAVLQKKLAPFGVSFCRGKDRSFAGIFALYKLPACVLSPVDPIIRCGMQLIEVAECNPAYVASELHKMVMRDENTDFVAWG
jgi:hypothetical protein